MLKRALIIFITIPFMHVYFSWPINFGWAGFRFRYTAAMSETVFFLLGQFLLTMITLGIYYPAAYVKIFRFLAERTAVENEEDPSKTRRVGFDGTAGSGFALIWGQALLSIITIGIYGSWALCRVSAWFAENTYIESEA